MHITSWHSREAKEMIDLSAWGATNHQAVHRVNSHRQVRSPDKNAKSTCSKTGFISPLRGWVVTTTEPGSSPSPPEVPIRKNVTSVAPAWCNNLNISFSRIDIDGTPIPCCKLYSYLSVKWNVTIWLGEVFAGACPYYLTDSLSLEFVGAVGEIQCIAIVHVINHG